MKKISRLGRGLDVLLAQSLSKISNNPKDYVALQTLNINDLQRGEFQPRGIISNESLVELTQSIKTQGVIQPLIARQLDNKKYEIIAGERRWRAAKLAGLTEVPVIVREIDDKLALAIGLIENIQREALTALEEARGLQQLIDDFSFTHKEVSNIVGRSRSSVSNLIRLLQLNEEVKKLLDSGDIDMGHARALLALDQDMQLEVAQRSIDNGLSVRQIESLVREILNPSPEKYNFNDVPHIKIALNLLQNKITAKIEIKNNKKNKGRIIIHYQSTDELNKIINHIN